MGLMLQVADKETLVVAVTGLGGKLNLSITEFFIAAGLEKAGKLILRDTDNTLLLGGLPPLLPCFADIVAYVRMQVDALRPQQFVITGTSGGAHAAMLLGHLLQADRVIAFAPYPCLVRSRLLSRHDPAVKSFSRIVDRLDRLPTSIHAYFDLEDVLADWNGKTRYDVHVSRDHAWDTSRSARLAGLPHVFITQHPYRVHAIASALARDNALAACFAPVRAQDYPDMARALA